jgi:hypothetical protein
MPSMRNEPSPDTKCTRALILTFPASQCVLIDIAHIIVTTNGSQMFLSQDPFVGPSSLLKLFGVLDNFWECKGAL